MDEVMPRFDGSDAIDEETEVGAAPDVDEEPDDEVHELIEQEDDADNGRDDPPKEAR